jgi:hypothetical protein
MPLFLPLVRIIKSNHTLLAAKPQDNQAGLFKITCGTIKKPP